MLKTRKISTDDKVLQFSSRKLGNTELIAGIIEGDPSAASQFHYRYSAIISRYVWRLLGVDDEHEDVLQQVLIGIISNLKTIKKPESLDSWVKSVTIRVVKHELRKRKKKRSIFRNAIAIEEDTSPDPNSPLKQAHIRSFYAILNKMPQDDRVVFVLKHLEGYSNEMIAEYCSYSVSTAKRRLERAKARFVEEAMTDYTLMSLLENGFEIK